MYPLIAFHFHLHTPEQFEYDYNFNWPSSGKCRSNVSCVKVRAKAEIDHIVKNQYMYVLEDISNIVSLPGSWRIFI